MGIFQKQSPKLHTWPSGCSAASNSRMKPPRKTLTLNYGYDRKADGRIGSNQATRNEAGSACVKALITAQEG